MKQIMVKIKKDENEMIVKYNRIKSKAHDTFLAKHTYTLKGPYPGVKNVSKVTRNKRL